ncbi:MAG TPA: GNAT family N-acetyltransferase [Sedimentisphaerales bacterium]|nr:GNAT family N-acetyltransferase [Sedimentisphaerales bacterium]
MSVKPLKITIRRADLEDKEAVMSILKRTKFFREDELLIAEEVFDDAIPGSPTADYQSFVARDANNKTIGWVCFGVTACTVGTFDIYWVAVDPENQNGGIGTLLMQYAEKAIKNSGGRLITVDTSGSPYYISTRRFYEKIGYCNESCIKDFYAIGDDKVNYIKRL